MTRWHRAQNNGVLVSGCFELGPLQEGPGMSTICGVCLNNDLPLREMSGRAVKHRDQSVPES